MTKPLPSGPLLLVRSTMETAIAGDFLTGRIAAFSTGCPDHPGPNEDAAAVIPVTDTQGVLAVADGVGGHPAGERASAIALERIVEALGPAVEAADDATDDGLELRGAIMNGFENANRAVLDQGSGGATTLAVVEIDGVHVRPYHAGDSAILVVGQRGRVKLLTVSHSPVGYALESGMLGESEALDHDERHVVSNLAGSADMRIEVGSPLELARYDTLLVGSDGLFDNFELGEIVDAIRKGSLERAADDLARECLARMRSSSTDRPSKPDDLTFVAYRRA
jgi:serine/threonine protein phosphatase PrpC